MPFVKNLYELLMIFMHFHLLLKQIFHITNTTFCHWAALNINSVYYSKNYNLSPLLYKGVCVCAPGAGIPQLSTFCSEQQEAKCVSINGLEQSRIQRWKKTQCGQVAGFRKGNLPLSVETVPIGSICMRIL